MTAKRLKELPIGQQTFEGIIQQNKLYVDKTGEIHKLLKPGVRYFLSRPRRFGKSLTCSTLAAIFEGRKELFKDLWLGQSDYAWRTLPVIHLDFNGIGRATPQALTKSLTKRLYDYARQEEIQLVGDETPAEALRSIIIALKKSKGPVVLIIDEYDKPITDHLESPELAKQMLLTLKEFYEVLKDAKVDAAVDFLFVTGVTKFSKVSLFSGVNNLDDISLDRSAAALVGYTQQEVEDYLADHIKALAAFEGASYAETLTKIKDWYNGYQFSDDKTITVYNPLSLHHCLNKQKFSNYWFATGTPTFLIDFVKRNPQIAGVIPGIEHEVLASSDLDAFALDLYYGYYKSVFVQTGYLSIRETESEGKIFTLAYPNREVRESMTEQIMAHVLHVTKEAFYGFVDEFRKALAVHGMNAFCRLMDDFYATIPYVVHSEKWYQNVFYVICKFLGFEVIVEYANQKGRMDAAIKTAGRTIVVELKRDKTPDAALAQIEDREYWRIFKTVPVATPVTLVGLSCAVVEKKGVGKKKKRGVSLRWKIKEVKRL